MALGRGGAVSFAGMDAITTFLSRPSNHWSHDACEAAWRELTELVDALPESAIASVDDRLARAYDDAGASAVCLEDDQRVAPLRWCVPEPRAALALAREVSLPPEVSDVSLLLLAASPHTRAITRVALRDRSPMRSLERLLPELLASPLFAGLDVLSLRESTIGGDDGAALLAGAPALASLGVLDLAFADVHEAGLEALLASPHLVRLERLVLEANALDPYGERGEPYWDALNARLDARGLVIDFV